MFIVLEGVEGSGKSTQVRLLAEWLAERGIEHLVVREPGGTRIGEEIRRALLHGGDDVPARTELLLMVAARAAFAERVVRPALERGIVVVSDRYELSSLAYQGYGRGLPLDEVRQVNGFATAGLSPDLTFVLDIEVEEGVARRQRAGFAADRIERAGDEFHREVARAYRLLSRTERAVELIGGGAEPEAVHAAIMSVLGSRFPETFSSAQG
ncbi:dTMP kinase [soil metagenome]